MKLFSFPRKKRLISNDQFRAVLARSLCSSDELLTLYIAENECGYARLGISIGKSCGSAVIRSRLKRLSREAFRQNQGQIPNGFDYLLMVRPQWSKKITGKIDAKQAIKKLTFEQIRTSFLALVDQAHRKKS